MFKIGGGPFSGSPLSCSFQIACRTSFPKCKPAQVSPVLIRSPASVTGSCSSLALGNLLLHGTMCPTLQGCPDWLLLVSALHGGTLLSFCLQSLSNLSTRPISLHVTEDSGPQPHPKQTLLLLCCILSICPKKLLPHQKNPLSDSLSTRLEHPEAKFWAISLDLKGPAQGQAHSRYSGKGC